MVDWNGTILPISASVGFVSYTHADRPADILTRADEMMYLQKHARRDVGSAVN